MKSKYSEIQKMSTDLRKIFSERLRKFRDDNDISQADIARKLGLKSGSAISSYENGKYDPKLPTLIKLNQLFGVSIDYLLGLSDFQKSGTSGMPLKDETREVLENATKALDVTTPQFIAACLDKCADEFAVQAMEVKARKEKIADAAAQTKDAAADDLGRRRKSREQTEKDP